MNTAKTKTGIVILNYNNAHDTINCINSIRMINTAQVKILIIDNGSKKEDVTQIESFLEREIHGYLRLTSPDTSNKILLPDFTLLISEKNLGYACGNNYGLKVLANDDEIDNILIVNNDILFIDDIIPILIQKQKQYPDCGILSPILYTKDQKTLDYTCARKAPSACSLIIKYLFMDLNLGGFSIYMDRRNYILKSSLSIPHTDIKVDLPSGSCMFINKRLFADIDWFDKNTFLYYEENILYRKLKRIHRQNYIIPNTRCIHLGASTTKSKPSSFLIKCNMESAFYYLRNYEDLSLLQKFFLHLAERMMKLKVYIFSHK